MTHELIKQLKYNNFPRSDLWYEDEHDGVKYFYPDASILPSVPTLEELIEACGDKFTSLVQVDRNEWTALSGCSPRNKIQEHYEAATSFTPSEAVANLWLALHKKDE